MGVILSGSCYFTSSNDGGEQKIVGFSSIKKHVLHFLAFVVKELDL